VALCCRCLPCACVCAQTQHDAISLIAGRMSRCVHAVGASSTCHLIAPSVCCCLLQNEPVRAAGYVWSKAAMDGVQVIACCACSLSVCMCWGAAMHPLLSCNLGTAAASGQAAVLGVARATATDTQWCVSLTAMVPCCVPQVALRGPSNTAIAGHTPW
jgi:hypothetical protein